MSINEKAALAVYKRMNVIEKLAVRRFYQGRTDLFLFFAQFSYKLKQFHERTCP